MGIILAGGVVRQKLGSGCKHGVYIDKGPKTQIPRDVQISWHSYLDRRIYQYEKLSTRMKIFIYTLHSFSSSYLLSPIILNFIFLVLS